MSGSGIPVVLVHGALRSPLGMWPSAVVFGRRGFRTHRFGYGTRHGTVSAHAERLGAEVEAWLGHEAPAVLGFFAHSMGALVVRAYLGSLAARPPPSTRIHRVVMLSPPNQGAELARRLGSTPWFRALYGDAARELLPETVAGLPPLPERTEVLILAGGTGDGRGYNPVLVGDDDGIVARSEMGFGGHRPRLVGGLHALLQWQPTVLELAARFLAGEPIDDSAVPRGGLEPPT